ncbi:MAG: hypothetical protein H7174_10080 [Flavobacterium sp.]|nr:hypothetical protein [Flavobacterium sp.]
MAITENDTIIKPYRTGTWVNLINVNNNDISRKLLIIEGLHKKWSLLLSSLNERDFDKTYLHSYNQEKQALNKILTLCAWHCNHRIVYVKQAIVNNYKF